MLTLTDIWHRYGTAQILRGLHLTLAPGEIVGLLGPSGCGKSTLLRIIAGLERPQQGHITLDGLDMTALPPHQRGIGLMFQDFALFPHMNVAQNVRFGMRMQRKSAAEQRHITQEMLALVGLPGHQARDISTLSGGEKQRVALARSLAPQPRLLLLDEPLGSLDTSLRERLLIDVRAILKRLQITALYVTHDQHEAFAIGDRVGLMNAGYIAQIDTPQKLYQHPASRFAAQFLGLTNLFPVTHYDGRFAHTPIGILPLAHPAAEILLHPDGLCPNDPDAVAVVQGRVRDITYQGAVFRVDLLMAGGHPLSFPMPARSGSLPPFALGDTLDVGVQAWAIVPLT